MNRRQTLLIAMYSARYSVRGGIGLVFLVVSLTFGLMVAHTMLQPVERFSRQAAERMKDREPAEVTKDVVQSLTREAKRVVAWMVSSETDAKDAASSRRAEEDAEVWADYLLDSRPGMLSAIFLILLFGWPLVVAFGAFDLYAGDISSRQLRYQLLRADRGSIFFGRLCGMLVTFVAVLVLLGVTVTVYMGCKLSAVYAWSDLIGWAAYGTLAMVCVSVPYIALCAWLSAACGGSFFSLTMASLAIGGVPLISLFARLQHEAGGYVLYLLPWGFQTRLFHHEPSHVALAVGGCALQALLFTWLGYRKFTTRDL